MYIVLLYILYTKQHIQIIRIIIYKINCVFSIFRIHSEIYRFYLKCVECCGLKNE